MNVRKIMFLIMVTMMSLYLVSCNKNESNGNEAWVPSKDITLAVGSSAGGGSDLFARKIAEIMANNVGVTESLIISNETDGGGEVVNNRVAHAKNDDHLLLALPAGAVIGMVRNTNLRVDDFTPLAILASEQSLFFKGEHSKFDDMSAFIQAAQAGEEIVIGGSKNNDIALKDKLLAELGIGSNANVEYIIYDSTSDALVALLGGHIELCIGRPSAALEYTKAGRITPVLAAAPERFDAPFDQAPTLSELGDFSNVEMPLWRGVLGPGNMSDEAAQYYIDVFKSVSKSDNWISYCNDNQLIPMEVFGDEAKTSMLDYQSDIIEAFGEK